MSYSYIISIVTNCVQFPSAKAVPRGNYCMVGMIIKIIGWLRKIERTVVSGGDECEEEEKYDEEESPMSTAVGFSVSQKKVSLGDLGEECR